jgi:hypothetical protein
VKRFYRTEWWSCWRDHFSVDIINGVPGHELKCDNRRLVSNYLRVGYDDDGSWRTFGLRKDFHPASKLAFEDDITASITVPAAALENLERCADFEYSGRVIPASRIGYRITQPFVLAFFGQIFNHPDALFTEEMLRPELQDLQIFVDGMDNIISTQKRVARLYFNYGSIQMACPPLRALLHIMLEDDWPIAGNAVRRTTKGFSLVRFPSGSDRLGYFFLGPSGRG